ncbi:AAA family ATPase [Paenibacillus sp. MBLB4367]|uniref:AAA family ATPase n=1 Tax=Paenibacillus sp. MBLB4367 TaxID=3384767 RepID=UPI003908184D
MSGRVSAASDNANGGKVSRQINVVLRNPEPPAPIEPEQLVGGKSVPASGKLGEIFLELEQMVGLECVKDIVYEVYALLQIGLIRAEVGLLQNAHVFHMVFKGNPGTGKTTVARIVARLFQEMGVLSKGHLIEVERADLVGEYIGHTALKTREMVKKSIGGILFIDEAYSLARGGEKDFGKEAIDTLVKAMEDYKNQFVLILAGYQDEMDTFLQTNPGLPSRFPIHIEFPDYTVDQLMQIAELMTKERQYVLSPQSELKLRQHLTQEKQKLAEIFSNARYVRNTLEKSIRHQAVRLLQLQMQTYSKQELMTLRQEDFRLDKKK